MIKNVMKKALCIGFAALMVTSSVTAASKKSKGGDPYKKVEKQKDPKTKKVYDFKGMNIVVGDWWTNPDAVPASKKAEDDQAFKEWLCSTYKMNIVQKQVAGWDSTPTYCANLCLSGGNAGEYDVLIIDGRSLLVGIRQHLFYDLSKVTSVNYHDADIYNQAVIKLGEKGKSFYAFNYGVSEPRIGIFFNKRLLEEAGYDPDEPYNLQKSGKWTWAKFEEMCKKLTRDTDNDGAIDQFAMGNFYTDFTHGALMSNGTATISRDANGKYYNSSGSDKAMEAFNWVQKMFANYQLPQGEGAWNYFETAFKTGQVAFMAHQEYVAQPNGTLSSMKDDFGFVCFPLGPSGDGIYHTLSDEPMMIIPNVYKDEEVNQMAKALELWKTKVPGYEDPESWKEDFYPGFRDMRAVDETIALMRQNAQPRYDYLIPGLSREDMNNSICWGWRTPAEEYEACANVWEALLKEVNR